MSGMKLEAWKEKHQLKNCDLAGKFGVDQSYITYLLQGKRRASPELAKRIEYETNGEVTRMEMLYPET